MAEDQQEVYVCLRPVPVSLAWERLWRWLLAPVRPEEEQRIRNEDSVMSEYRPVRDVVREGDGEDS